MRLTTAIRTDTSASLGWLLLSDQNGDDGDHDQEAGSCERIRSHRHRQVLNRRPQNLAFDTNGLAGECRRLGFRDDAGDGQLIPLQRRRVDLDVGAWGIVEVIAQGGKARNRGRRIVANGDLDLSIEPDQPIVHGRGELPVPHHAVDVKAVEPRAIGVGRRRRGKGSEGAAGSEKLASIRHIESSNAGNGIGRKNWRARQLVERRWRLRSHNCYNAGGLATSPHWTPPCRSCTKNCGELPVCSYAISPATLCSRRLW